MKYWQIESNVSIPAPSGLKRGPKPKYPFGEMKIGDSVFFDDCNTSSNCIVAAYNYGRRKNMKFSARSQDEGVRIWRVA